MKDLELTEKVKKIRYEKLKKDRHWKSGYKAAAKGLKRSDNPYKIPEDVVKLLRKRAKWELGWEEKAYTPTKAKLRQEAKMEKKRKHGHKH
jgi:hypothetical protein